MDNKSFNTYPMTYADQSSHYVGVEEEVFFNDQIRSSYFKSMEVAQHNLSLIDKTGKGKLANKEHKL